MLEAQPAGGPSAPTQRRRLLVIAYYFPPMGLSGVLRISKFVRYLRDFGWNSTVLTVGEVSYYAHDYSLLEEVIAAGVRIERTASLDPLALLRRVRRNRETVAMQPAGRRRFLSGVTHTFLQPDNKIGWKRHALRRAKELIAEEPFDAILATAPPFTSFLIGRQLQEQFDIPLVVDYRDPWLDNRNYFYATPMHRRYAAGLEEDVLKNADGIVVVNRRIKERLIERYRFLTHETVHILPSGYDPEDFERAARDPIPSSGKMRITFGGAMMSTRTPKPFFAAVAKLFAEQPDARDEIELCFVGTFQDRYRRMAERAGVASSLRTTGYVDHLDAVRWLCSSDLLWLMTDDPSVTPGKLHEYVGAGKPILALVPEGGVVRQVLADYGASKSVDPDDIDAIKAAIVDFHRQWKQGLLPSGDPALAREFDQHEITGRLARVLAYSLRI